MPRKAAKKEEPKKDPPEKKWFLKLPANLKKGDSLTLVYSEERTKELALEHEEFNFGPYHGFVDTLEGPRLIMQFVYANGEAPEEEEVNLETGIDVTYNVAVSEVKTCPIPLAVLKKWRAAGLAAASSRSEEELEEAEETEDTETEYE
jgi:hypothetical protein